MGDHQGAWQTIIVERKEGAGPLLPGDRIYLKTHTGNLFVVEGDMVHAKWSNKGSWEEITVEKDGADTGPVRVGDSIFLRAHTGKRLSVQDSILHAKWDHKGSWQRFVVE